MTSIADFPPRSSSADDGRRCRTFFLRAGRSLALVVLASLAWFCPVLSGHAENSSFVAALEGRWVDAVGDRKLVLDVLSCGEESWCGVAVADGACGATVLRVKQAAEKHVFTGKLELAAGAQPYFVELRAWRTAEADHLRIDGDSRGDLSPYRRWYPFTALMVRRGNAQCRLDAKTS
jgi:hypothetical protein